MDHVKLEMEEFMSLGDLWAPVDLTFDVSHFDDLEVSEAQDGLYDHSFKPKPEAQAHFDLQDLLDVQGCLGLDWMEQPCLPSHSPEREERCVGESIADLLEDDLLSQPVAAPRCSSPGETQPQGISTESALLLLQSLQRQQAEVMEMDSPVKLETIEVEAPLSPTPSSPEAQVAPEIDFGLMDTPLLVTTEVDGLGQVLDGEGVEFLQAPLSPEDVESLLSSNPSPSVSPAPSTIDSSSLYSSDSSFVCNTSDLYEVVSNDGASSRGSPYSRPRGSSKSPKSKGRKQTASISDGPSELEFELMSKKDRKKLQNKNAAIRYRQKKKAESDEKKSEEDQLEAENARLKERVEEISREIGYMKGLINEVRKARGLPPHRTCQ